MAYKILCLPGMLFVRAVAISPQIDNCIRKLLFWGKYGPKRNFPNQHK